MRGYGKSIENHKYGVNGGFTLRQTAAAEQAVSFSNVSLCLVQWDKADVVHTLSI